MANPPERDRTMQAATEGRQALSRRLIAAAALQPHGMENDAFAVQVACERAYHLLSRSIGVTGFNAMLTRALAQAEPAHPLLKDLRVSPKSEPVLHEIADLVAVHGAPAVAAALTAALDEVFALLGRLIGDDMVARLVDRGTTHTKRDAEDAQ